ncbi:tRNA lysidine(34) synthetase TilS [Dyadobacter tibetensis]|uniref:tRNA lysidine(34) synthetase TilS n=1 Tax=Dyadobacter tibetensis TaxID=1211851 RepID=UPI00047297BC|nr:tRNA lysidine(34) synthetase TilS [Dyadobacter tibetensis]
MLDAFLTFINQFEPKLSERPTIVASSGGIDSMVLLDLMARAGLPVVVAHCNFGLRGQASIDDESFVRSKAKAYGFPFTSIQFDTKGTAKKLGVSTQMAARSLRYNWFEEIRRKEGGNWIATAHHLNDSLETTLLNLTRGTGIEGLKGVPVVNGAVIRPLLFAERKEIEAYAAKHQIAWVEDISNASLDYGRNLIRHRVVPVLQSLNPALEAGFKRSSERLRSANTLLEEYLDDWARQTICKISEGVSISYARMWDSTEPLYRLWYLLQAYGFSYAQMPAILEASKSEPGRKFYSDTHCILADRQMYIVQERAGLIVSDAVVIEKITDKVSLETGLLEMYRMPVSSEFSGKRDARVIYFDVDILHWPLCVRPWKQGDRIKSFGMEGKSQKVSDLLIDRKLNRFEKGKVQVLTDSDGQILWVIGLRSSELGKITGATKVMLKLKFTPKRD